MTPLLGAVLCAAFAGGACMVVDGAQRSPASEPRISPARTPRRAGWGRRSGFAAAAFVLVVIASQWPVAAAGAGLLGWFSPTLFGSKAARDLETARTEAIASWTEMLRDTIAGARGIEEAITTSATVAPAAIADEVVRLAAALEHHSLTRALRSFSTDLAHPTGDLVVASLTMAAEGAVGDLGELLGALAVAAREEAGMRLRVDAARARLRTAVRVIAGCTAVTAAGLVVLNRPYLAPYESAVGQTVLLLVCALWGVGLWWLARMGDFLSPERFLASPDRAVAEGQS